MQPSERAGCSPGSNRTDRQGKQKQANRTAHTETSKQASRHITPNTVNKQEKQTEMADVTLTMANSAGFIPSYWAQKALDVLRNNIVMAKLVTKDSAWEPGWYGQQLNIPYPGTFTAQSKSANSNATVQTPSGGTSVAVTLNSHQYVDFIVEDVANAQANSDLLMRYIQPAIVALAEKVETDLLAQYTGMTSTNPVGTAGTNLSFATILNASKALTDAKIAQNPRYMAISTKDQVALLQDSNLASYFAYAKSEQLTEGALVRLGGFELYVSQLIPTTSGATSQTVTIGGSPTGGTFTLTFNSQTTAGIAWNANAAAVQTALAALSSVGAGNVYVTGGPSPTTAFAVNFIGSLSGTALAITGSAAGLTGGTPTITIANNTNTGTRNVAFHPEAIMLATRPFRDPPPGSGVQTFQMQDPVSGLSIRVLHQYDINARGVRVGFDMLYGVATLRNAAGMVVFS